MNMNQKHVGKTRRFSSTVPFLTFSLGIGLLFALLAIHRQSQELNMLHFCPHGHDAMDVPAITSLSSSSASLLPISSNANDAAAVTPIPTVKFDIRHNASCRILITNKIPDFHYEILESIAMRYPLPWEILKQGSCRDSGLSGDDPILVDYLLSFVWKPALKNEDMEGWGWKTYFDQHLVGRIRNRTATTDGRFIQFRSIVGITEDDLYNKVDWEEYAAEIEASCDVAPQTAWRWMRQSARRFCVLHGVHGPIARPFKEIQRRMCYLNPQHAPNCWFIPADYPKFNPPQLPFVDGKKLRICIPSPTRKDPTPLIQALQKTQPSNVEIFIPGRNAIVHPNFVEANLSHLVVTQSDLKAYLDFQQTISQCHVMIPLVEPKGESISYYTQVGDTKSMGKLSGFVSQLIGNGKPSLLHTSIVDIYGSALTARHYAYDSTDDGSSFTAAFQAMLASFQNS